MNGKRWKSFKISKDTPLKKRKEIALEVVKEDVKEISRAITAAHGKIVNILTSEKQN